MLCICVLSFYMCTCIHGHSVRDANLYVRRMCIYKYASVHVYREAYPLHGCQLVLRTHTWSLLVSNVTGNNLVEPRQQNSYGNVLRPPQIVVGMRSSAPHRGSSICPRCCRHVIIAVAKLFWRDGKNAKARKWSEPQVLVVTVNVSVITNRVVPYS